MARNTIRHGPHNAAASILRQSWSVANRRNIAANCDLVGREDEGNLTSCLGMAAVRIKRVRVMDNAKQKIRGSSNAVSPGERAEGTRPDREQPREVETNAGGEFNFTPELHLIDGRIVRNIDD